TLILAGANDYDSMCAACHGAPGMSPEAVGQGLNPPAPDLAEEVLEMTPAELFWVTKNGIKMTGMPAWGVTHDDQTIWPVVAFMTRLPGLDQAAYKELLADAEGVGYHGENTTPEHAGSGDHEHDNSIGPDTVPETADEHDHETHEH
ncbi:MAG: c-type cytochrome, partial [Paracoccaceae bacterium]